MSAQQTRRARASSDRAHAMPPGMPQRPGMGNRTSSAPEDGLYKLDAGRRPASVAKVGHTLLEEDEGSSSTSHETPKRSRSRRRSEDVWFIEAGLCPE